MKLWQNCHLCQQRGAINRKSKNDEDFYRSCNYKDNYDLYCKSCRCKQVKNAHGPKWNKKTRVDYEAPSIRRGDYSTWSGLMKLNGDRFLQACEIAIKGDVRDGESAM